MTPHRATVGWETNVWGAQHLRPLVSSHPRESVRIPGFQTKPFRLFCTSSVLSERRGFFLLSFPLTSLSAAGLENLASSLPFPHPLAHPRLCLAHKGPNRRQAVTDEPDPAPSSRTPPPASHTPGAPPAPGTTGTPACSLLCVPPAPHPLPHPSFQSFPRAGESASLCLADEGELPWCSLEMKPGPRLSELPWVGMWGTHACAHMHTKTHPYSHANTDAYMHTHTNTRIHSLIHRRAHSQAQTHIRAHTHAHPLPQAQRRQDFTCTAYRQ